jgi:hypothetical protein
MPSLLYAEDGIFLYVQHRNWVNESLIGPNRLYVSYGFRFSPHIDLGLGFYVWTQQEEEMEWRNVYQLKVTTAF